MKTVAGCDVAIIGGGPVGSVAALAFAKRGARVVVLEANAAGATRLAGEWLHPPAVAILDELGIELHPERYAMGRGFVVMPDDGSAPIVLPYAEQRLGASLHHALLVAKLRQRLVANDAITYIEGARALALEGHGVRYRIASGAERIVEAKQIVGATGRKGFAHSALAAGAPAQTYSRMAGLLLKDVTLPHEGYGHVCLGAPGPVLMYRVSLREVRVCLDVPLSFECTGERAAALYEAYAPAIPAALRSAFERALIAGKLAWAGNQTRLRRSFGRADFALVGDAVGHHHPLTAAGLTFGFLDAVALARAQSFVAYRGERDRAGRVGEVLAIALYDIFKGTSDETVAMRKAVFALWRSSAAERERTMRLLAGDATNLALFAVPFAKVFARAGVTLIARGHESGALAHGASAAARLARCAQTWLAAGALHLHEARASEPTTAPLAASAGQQPARTQATPARALDAGIAALLARQNDDGSWEGECRWCPMLPAQYVLAWHIMGQPIDPLRQRRVLLHFTKTQLASGAWALSEGAAPSLFVTTLVYVASRVLGVAADDPWLARARAFIAANGGGLAIPTWGKLWLALLSLYRWQGVNPIAPELWALPRALPVHPSRYYCHTRLIYMAMATLYAERLQRPADALTHALRDELFPQGFEAVDFAAARGLLRAGDLYARPTRVLELCYAGLSVVERFRSRTSRAGLLGKFREAMRWELAVSSHTALSPVSGLLSMLALWHENPNDPDLTQAIARFECWIWEDDRDGLRVAGARSAIWDSSFAMQTLAAAGPRLETAAALTRASEFLRSQQLRTTFPDYAANHRTDPRGGYPFSFAWHGWPVSDCTAEAMLARLELGGADAPSDDDVALAAAFVLRCQGPDGGFGSYEAPRVAFSLEWLNPAEMFGDSMTETGYVECTASCVAALAKFAELRPQLLRRSELAGIPAAIARALESLRRKQYADGPWPGAWAVELLYGTWFGVRGLLSGGAPVTDPAIRKACAWLKARQNSDGSWGERSSLRGRSYAPHDQGQVVQTAWAMLTLCEACDPEFAAIERAADFIARMQLGSGEWPRQDPCGLFFRTALLDYELYRSYFPVWALAVFETRRKARMRFASASPGLPRQSPAPLQVVQPALADGD